VIRVLIALIAQYAAQVSICIRIYAMTLVLQKLTLQPPLVKIVR